MASKITIEANKKTINFLDVILDLPSGSYKPFMKPNNKILYVHHQSNHPPALLNNIPDNINNQLTSISSSQKVFNDAIPLYQKVLDEGCYKHKLTYNLQSKRQKSYGTTPRDVSRVRHCVLGRTHSSFGRREY